MRKLPPILSKDLTATANGQGIKGQVYIVNHHYYLDHASERRRIGFTRQQAESYILRKAVRQPMINLEVEEPEEKALPGQIALIQPEGQLSLI